MNVKKMIALVQLYIFHRKGVEIQIRINGMMDMIKLQKAYQYAMGWFDFHDVKISVRE